jgi:hypothetical protein
MTRHTIPKWTGTILQASGCLLLALNLSYSGWAFPIMLAGSSIWLLIATVEGEVALAALNLFFSATNLIGIWRWLG